jgi:Ca-activated chloride channel homolog
VKQAMRLLVEQLDEGDRVAIVTYAGDTGVALPSARGNEQKRILTTIDALQSGGCTNGGAGIELAYQQAAEHFVAGGVNRVILCTDGDLNVGITDDKDLEKLIQQKAKSGVFLTVLGFGTGNLKDSKMEKLADQGNGVYAYIDCLREAHRVLVEQLTGSLVTIAKDVKIQVEFNPAEAAEYRLVGYENRVMANRDFNDDRKDAGDIGAGHTVTALYEIVPTHTAGTNAGKSDEPLKYQHVPQPQSNLTERAQSGEMLTVRLRYKEPDGQTSRLLEIAAKDSGAEFDKATTDFRFAASVAAFGLVLRNSPHRGDATLGAVEKYAASAIGQDPDGYRAEFLDLVRKARGIATDKR